MMNNEKIIKKSSLLAAKKKENLNVTYSVEEIDIDIKRPNIDESNDMIKVYTDDFGNCQKQVHFDQQAKFTIKKQKLSSGIKTSNNASDELKRTIKTNNHTHADGNAIKNNLPTIVVSDWDLERTTSRISKVDTTTSQPLLINDKQIAPKIVEEITIDQFQRDLLSINNSDNCLANNDQEQKQSAIRLESFQLKESYQIIKNKSTTSFTSTNSRGSYIIIKNGLPADINFELFESLHEREIQVTNSEQELTDYYMNKENVNATNAIENQPLLSPYGDTQALNVFENDEYNLYNFKHLKKIEDSHQFNNVELSHEFSGNQEKQSVHNLQVPQFKKEFENFDFYYFYSSWKQCSEIFTKRCINMEKIFYENKLLDGIPLLTLPPCSSDTDLLLELYGPNVPVDKNRVQCCIKLRRAALEKNKTCLIKLSAHKYICKRRIEFESKFPKHEFRSKFNKCKD